MHSFSLLYIFSLLLNLILFVSSILAGAVEDPALAASTLNVVRPDGPSPSQRLPPQRRLSAQLRTHRRRASLGTCPADYTQCGNGLPTGFCCGATDTCLSVAEGTTALCCPAGQNCDSIVPLSCNVAYQNATAYPTLAVHTTNLTGQLPTCGSGCCPFGYACSDNTSCELIKNENELVTATTTASVSTARAIASASGSASALIVAPPASTTPALTPDATPNATPSESKDDASSHTTSSRTIGIAAGSAAAGLISIITIITLIWARRRRRLQGPPQRSATAHNTPEPPAGRDRHMVTSLSQFPNTPPPLPEKEPYQLPPKKKRKSILSWVPSFINRGSPAELPATPVDFGAWGRQQQQQQQQQWGGQPQRPDPAHQLYPRDSLEINEVYELEARWLPQERFI